MNKILFTTALTAMAFSSAMAQETYESATIATKDLNGTARYVGMGGALEALGADISTISTNPAGIALFRRSQVIGTAGAVSVGEGKAASPTSQVSASGKNPASLDQFGFVIASKSGHNNYVNFAVNYHKSRNFNQILSVTDNLSEASQNKGSYIKGIRGLNGDTNEGFYPDYSTSFNEYRGYTSSDQNNTDLSGNFSRSDYLLWNAFITGDDLPCYNDAAFYNLARDQKGYIGCYDINLSGNIDDRIYLGITAGIEDVHYHHNQAYRENILGTNDYDQLVNAGYLLTTDQRDITGQGYNIKVGAIIRPVETSPLRIGVSIASPTWYELKSRSYTRLDNHTPYGDFDNGHKDEVHRYKVYTPWNFGASIGTTIGQVAALGLSYDYSDYSSVDNRIITDEYYDYEDVRHTESESDDRMNSHTEKTLQGVHTLKAGAEIVPIQGLSLRLGYNYVSPMYKKNGERNLCLDTDGCYYASTTDYVNWGATNRFTCGIGFAIDNFTIDAAYQYSTQKGDFYPFQSLECKDGDMLVSNHANAVKVDNNRHQFLISLGYRF